MIINTKGVFFTMTKGLWKVYSTALWEVKVYFFLLLIYTETPLLIIFLSQNGVEIFKDLIVAVTNNHFLKWIIIFILYATNLKQN